ncbi:MULTISPECIES: hypothetical protein [Chryseobacterium]|uniref:Glycosyl transferase family 2 n=1 Tax=Chryseobacterium camelliae TaxID=1265445 RepID=A0ABU0TDP6_9FLAO|nr:MULTISPECIES: hypothetical protein [Chryseobacterium]MDT3407091.1 hypothetical protein [Pseudacidovorax intermedius]MDQ1095117.1 hypothetical protein [Chryseobacterium camelliae]MDQ1099055.1 hypothetical protein [Chryseobacterium sp. SORGH_AS_1048]MDR6086404.1 hypothetical protein [Chryseobacterium sp. SORGH_AS_0909]MDR6130776.1 hypothetical protein [Chryseobacterium sp. SORGH_AS_1175]
MKSILSKIGMVMLRESQLDFIKHYYGTIQENLFISDNNAVFSIIFSKDRAMQLDAFLRSYFTYVTNPGTVKILYYVSSQEHDESYETLKELYSDKPVVFIKETHFRDQLISTLEESVEDKVILFVDDMLFTRKIDFKSLTEIDPFKNIVALSRGKDLLYSTVLSKKIETPRFKKSENNWLSFSWSEIKEFSDWTFPLGTSGYMYSRKELLYMLKSISFKAPNSMEGQMQLFNIYFKDRKGICGEQVITPCIHANITQTEGYNPVTGHFSLEELLQEWKSGKRIKFEEFYELPVTEAEVKKYSFVDR